MYFLKITPRATDGDRARILLFPLMLVVAWLYFPFCQDGPKFCIWLLLFGKACPGCGLTRGICYLVRGHLSRALMFNAFTPFVFVGVLAISLKTAFEKILPQHTREVLANSYVRLFNRKTCGG